jgi:hypothetical protein
MNGIDIPKWISEGTWVIGVADGLLYKIVIIATDHSGVPMVGYKHGTKSYILAARFFREEFKPYESA